MIRLDPTKFSELPELPETNGDEIYPVVKDGANAAVRGINLLTPAQKAALGTIENLDAIIDQRIDNNLGVNIATLENGKVPNAQLPEYIINSQSFAIAMAVAL